MRRCKWMGAVLVGLNASLWLSGCFTGGIWQVPGHESLAGDLSLDEKPRVARSQLPDPPNPNFRPPLGQLIPVAPPPPPPPSSGDGIKQTNLAIKTVRVSVRAYVNGKPIFDDEVMQAMNHNALRELNSMPEPRRSEEMTKLYNQALEGIIDQELAMQDAIRKLEAMNKQALEKLKKYAALEFEKQLKRVRDSGKITEEQIREVENTMRRQTERSLISGEYMRSRIKPIVDSAASPGVIKDYYDTHLNEFQVPDSVEWQDVFIGIGPKHPSVADAKRFAEDLIAQCRTNDDFTKLFQFDDRDSNYRNGNVGQGTLRKQIRPAEVEEALFQLKAGQIGPVVALSTGVHMIRVIKREYAGLTPLNEKTQKLIETKIRNDVAEKEYKRIIRELRSRATIEIIRQRTDEK
jgi:peptidyl-prolyl cis-trans isomerase SurA